jgi:hypothetical protein
VYESRNQHDEALAINAEIKASEARVAAFEATQAHGYAPPPSAMKADFFHPTPAMKAEAAAKGIDLDDPAVLKILQKLQVGGFKASEERRNQGGASRRRVSRLFLSENERSLIGVRESL